MSPRDRLARNIDTAHPANDALRAASQDLSRAFHFTPTDTWNDPANVNTRTAGLQPFLKRLADLMIAVPALIVLAPLFGMIALAIRLDTAGPVFFRQTRLGRHGRPFDIFKFRTMNVLENGDTVVQASQNDSRITRAGAWLRSSSLDELPQLLNVIAGEMSLVGPRPHARAHDVYYAAHIPGYDLRQGVKPGITGWAQVHGYRGETPELDDMRRRVDHDIWYAGHANLALDFEILLRTPFEVFSGRNAH